MGSSLAAGLALVVLAGVCQGSFMLPSKRMRGWAFENYWLIFAATAYLISPWLLALATIPNLAKVYSGVTPRSLASVLIFGVAWGIGAVLFGLAVEAVGLALGFAVILGISTVCGTLIPLIAMTPAQFSVRQGIWTAVSLVLMLGGVGICSLAGKWREGRESGSSRKSYRTGLLLCICSGVFSACGNLGFAFGADIARRARDLGAPDYLASNALWALLTLPLFLCNAGYAIYLLKHNGTVALYRKGNTRLYVLLAVIMGVLWMAGFLFYGMGARKLGPLGPSLGWAILMSSMVLIANLLGMWSGEWKGAPRQSLRNLGLGLAMLVLSIAGLGLANG